MSRGISTIDPGSSIPELVDILKQSFRESEFDAVQDVLMDRERKMKIEIENLRIENESAKKEALLWDKSRKLAESEKLILEKELLKSREECVKLNDIVASFKTKFGEMEKAIKVLRQGSKELKRQKVESDEKAECYKMRVDNLEPRIMRVESGLADILNVKVVDLAPIANTLDKSAAAANGDNAHINSGDGSTKEDGASYAQTSPGSQPGGSPSLVDPRVPGKVIGAHAGNVIEICDSDDESNCDDKIVSETSLTKSKKRSRIYISDEEVDNIATDGKGKENQDPESTQDRITNAGPFDDSQTHDTWTDSDSEDDSSSCSDGHMNSLVATIQSKKLGRT